MKVPYLLKGPTSSEFRKNFPSITQIFKPLIPIVLRFEGRKQKLFALVDSGADACLFPRGIADVLGIDVRSGGRVDFTGIGGMPTPFYFHEIEILFGEHRVKTRVGFSTSLNIGTGGILGQHGFFDNFIITFDRKNRFIEVKRHNVINDLAAKLPF
ncbi:MAG: hypothetical protein HY447_02705 [Candidatus Omnitrophica bacterium]|nr:hypothetical protein [Candidatus Omnitrophota bacterium]